MRLGWRRRRGRGGGRCGGGLRPKGGLNVGLAIRMGETVAVVVRGVERGRWVGWRGMWIGRWGKVV